MPVKAALGKTMWRIHLQWLSFCFHVSCVCVSPHLVPLLQLVVRELGVLPQVLQHLRPQLAVLFPHDVSGTGGRRRFFFSQQQTGSAALAGELFFFPCWFFLCTPVNPKREEWMSATIKQTGGWPPVTNERRGGRRKNIQSAASESTSSQSLQEKQMTPAR